MRFGFLFASLAVSRAEYATPPVQTENQRKTFEWKQKEAKTASEEATPAVLAFFDSADFRKILGACCPGVTDLSAQQLLERFRAEVKASELAHAFPSAPCQPGDRHCSPDMHVATGFDRDWFLNLYQAQFLQSGHAGGGGHHGGGDRYPAEREIFGCPAWRDPLNATWEEASDRLIYIAHNLRQVDIGSNPHFGDAIAVFNNNYVSDMVLIAAVDTGIWVGSCPTEGGTPNPKLDLNCSYLTSSVVGTYEYHDHLILASIGAWTGTSGQERIYDEARMLFERSPVAGSYSGLPAMQTGDIKKYWEANIVGNPKLDAGVKFMIGTFKNLFGVDTGKQLQALADKYMFPIVWVLGDADGTSFPGNQRVLDPVVAATASLNITLPEQASETFKSLWDEVAAGRDAASDEQWSSWWGDLFSQQAHVAPVTAACLSDLENCIAVDPDTTDCICRSSAGSAMLA